MLRHDHFLSFLIPMDGYWTTIMCPSSSSAPSSSSSSSSSSMTTPSSSSSSSSKYGGIMDEESLFDAMIDQVIDDVETSSSSSSSSRSDKSRNDKLPWKSVILLACLAIFGISVGLYGRKLDFTTLSKSTGSITDIQNLLTGGVASVSLAFADVDATIEVSSPDYGVSQALQHLPWDAVAEAYRDQNIRITLSYTSSSGVVVSASEEDVIVKWQILGQKYTGVAATFNAAAIPGVYECTVSVKTASDETEVFSKTFTMAVKYIRREVRSLTDTDRNTFFKALKIMYETELDEGKKLYGEKFNNAEYFLLKHLNGAGRSDCDHWHDGAAFINKHLAFTLEAEQSLQSIDKTIAMPYWEYFQDAYLTRWQESNVFAQEWYGEASPMNGDHAPAGIWRDLQVPDASKYGAAWSISKEGSLNPYVNAYGHMRSPWNNNPSKFLGRHNQTYGMSIDHMPNCKIMSQCYQSGDLAAMTNCLNGVTHGPVHVLIGGSWGEGSMFDEGDINFVRNINKVLYFKNLWRTGYTRCPTTCKEGEVCRCAIPQAYLDTYDVDTIFKNADIYDQIIPHMKNKDEVYKLKVLKALEDPGIVGEMLTSAAPYDPAFWPIHGQLERVLGLKRAKKSMGEINFDETWGFGGASGKYLAGVCDWSRIESVQDLTLPECDFTGETTCSGHDENDDLEFSNFLDLKETYTNAEFYEFVHPWSDSLPYTYDKFDFEYCSAYGVNI